MQIVELNKELALGDPIKRIKSINLNLKNKPETYDSFNEIKKQHFEITSMAKEGYIESLKRKSMDDLLRFNKMKGGDYETME